MSGADLVAMADAAPDAPVDAWPEAKRKVAQAYNALVALAGDPAALGPVGTMRVVLLPDDLECRITVARRPAPGEFRIPIST